MGRSSELDAEIEQRADLSTFHGRLVWARDRMGLIQDELAKRINKSRATIAAYENDRATPDLKVIERIAEELAVDPRFLAFGSGPGYEPMEAELGFSVSVIPSGTTESRETKLTLPKSLGSALGLSANTVKLIELAVDSPYLGLAKGQWLFVDATKAEILPDGELYALLSSAGATVVRTAPALTDGETRLSLTGDHGQHYRVHVQEVRCLGRVIATLGRI